MTLQLGVAYAAAGCILAVWTLRLVRRDRLYVGYGVLVLLSLAASLVAVAVPPARAAITAMFGGAAPLWTFALAAAAFTFLILIYLLSQLTIVSNRLTQLVQELALRQTDAGPQNATARPDGSHP